jgi:hypothetical protein
MLSRAQAALLLKQKFESIDAKNFSEVLNFYDWDDLSAAKSLFQYLTGFG